MSARDDMLPHADLPRSETIHGVLAGRPMARWREDIKGAREDLMRGIALALTCARILAARRPTAQQITCEREIALDEREVVHSIVDGAYATLYDAIDALEAARVQVDTAHRLLGYIPAEWTRADTLRWMEQPDLYGCTDDDVRRVERGLFATPTPETQL